MIQNIDVSTQTVVAGHPIEVVIDASAPITVQVSCFVTTPPPPRYTTCTECQTYQVNSGELITVYADPANWSNKQGGYEFRVVDAAGDTRVFRVAVTTRVLARAH